ncbi:MAG: hypothetical protein H6Q52_1651 [Deltaproteobacteria bacterium]|nr:hypothetical protein [Deltaproteobacteria bacterium]
MGSEKLHISGGSRMVGPLSEDTNSERGFFVWRKRRKDSKNKKGGEAMSETLLSYLFILILVIIGGLVVYVTAKRMENNE